MQNTKPDKKTPESDKDTLIQSLLFLITDRIGFIRRVQSVITREVSERGKRIVIGLILLTVSLGFLFSAAIAVNFLLFYTLYNFTGNILIGAAGLLVFNLAAGLLFLIYAFRWFAHAAKALTRPGKTPDSHIRLRR